MVVGFHLTKSKDYDSIVLLMQQGTTYNESPKEIVSKLTRKGQVTIPVAVRRHLGVSTDDKIAFIIESNGKVQVTQAKYPDIASLSGAAGSLKKSFPWKEVLRIARADHLKEKYGKRA